MPSWSTIDPGSGTKSSSISNSSIFPTKIMFDRLPPSLMDSNPVKERSFMGALRGT